MELWNLPLVNTRSEGPNNPARILLLFLARVAFRTWSSVRPGSDNPLALATSWPLSRRIHNAGDLSTSKQGIDWLVERSKFWRSGGESPSVQVVSSGKEDFIDVQRAVICFVECVCFCERWHCCFGWSRLSSRSGGLCVVMLNFELLRTPYICVPVLMTWAW